MGHRFWRLQRLFDAALVGFDRGFEGRLAANGPFFAAHAGNPSCASLSTPPMHAACRQRNRTGPPGIFSIFLSQPPLATIIDGR